ncbi:MFS transporter [Dethiothermospora halolimnae]|uniref:MFS transporter n=1 Tax=Dethiothermospora halolimnae TaxID=3114390 RepID=UPI003CCC2B22
MNKRDKILSNIWKLYGYYFFHNLIFAYVIERLYWQQRGITIQQVVYTEIIYALVIVILEIPTGYLADKWSRKSMLVLAGILTFLDFFILIYADSFFDFALAVFIAGIQSALSSGTTNALLYDSLKTCNEQDKFEKVLGRLNFFDYGAATIGALVGSFVASRVSYVSTYWMSLVSVTISFLFAISLIEPKIKTKEDDDEKNINYIKEAYIFLKGNASIRFVLLLGIVMSSVTIYVDEFFSIYLKEISIPVILFGVISGANSLIISVSSIFAYKIKERFSYKSIFSGLITLFTISLILLSIIKVSYGVIALFIFYFSSAMIEPLVSGYLHHRTKSSYRATVESFQSLVMRVSTIGVGLLFGVVSTGYSIFIGFRALGILSFIYLVYYGIRQFKYLK